MGYLKTAKVNEFGRVIGEKHHRAKLSDHEIDLCLELLAEGMSKAEIARKLEISRQAVRDYELARRRAQTAIGVKVFTRPPRYRGARPARAEEFDLIDA